MVVWRGRGPCEGACEEVFMGKGGEERDNGWNFAGGEGKWVGGGLLCTGGVCKGILLYSFSFQIAAEIVNRYPIFALLGFVCGVGVQGGWFGSVDGVGMAVKEGGGTGWMLVWSVHR